MIPDRHAPPGTEPEARGKWMALLAAFLGWMFDGMEMGLFPLAGRPALRELLAARVAPGELEPLVQAWFGWIIAAFLVGAAAGGILFGWMGDRIGRVKAMVWSVLTYSVFSGLCAFAAAPWQIGALRFIAALGMGGEWSLGVALVMEIWPARSRPILAGLIGAAANVGFLLAGLLGLLVPSADGGWRTIFLIGAAPAFLTFFIRIFVPESERWKHAAATTPKTRVSEIFAPGIAGRTILGACLAGLALVGTWGSVQWIPNWTGQFTGGRTGAAEWAQNALAVGAILFTILAALLAEKSNRRIAYFLLCLTSLATCQYLFRARPDYGTWFLFVTFLVGGLTAAFYGWLPLYLPELFPTRVRATGAGFAFNIGRILGAVGAVTGGELVKRVFEGDVARMCSWVTLVYALGMLVIWLCPETKGRPLPE